MSENRDAPPPPVTADHRRQFEAYRYVYPVIARRSKGLSLGVNLNPDKRCNYSCVYCQIDRHVRRDLHHVDLDQLRRELLELTRYAAGGEIWRHPRFAPTPPPLRRLNDIALSGDGEPTCLPDFDRAVAIAADVRRSLNLDQLKLVIITNASQLDQPRVRRALPILDANNGEIWAKLDAGTQEYFQRVNRPAPPVTLRHILANIAALAQGRPVVIQTLLVRLDGQEPSPQEIAAYCRNLQSILAGGGRIKLVQLHTTARPPAEDYVGPLSAEQLERIARHVREALGHDVPVEVYPSVPR
jgi:wyosine [tRNA(Phe)-imidazoG37] synthetase (radical SAM superfamily)